MASAPEFTFGSMFTSAKKFIFGDSTQVDTRKMSASDPEYQIQQISPTGFDIQNVSGAIDFESHDELSVIEPMQTHDDIPEPSKMVDHDTLSTNKH